MNRNQLQFDWGSRDKIIIKIHKNHTQKYSSFNKYSQLSRKVLTSSQLSSIIKT